MLRVLHRACLRRPVVLWLDDAQWGPEALALVPAPPVERDTAVSNPTRVRPYRPTGCQGGLNSTEFTR